MLKVLVPSWFVDRCILDFFLFASFPLTVFLCFGSCFFSFCWGDNFLRHKRWDILLQIYIRWHSWTRERFSSKQETPYNWLIDAWTSFRSIHYIFFLYFTWIQFCSWWLLFLSKAKQGSCLCIIAPELLGLRSLHKRSTGLFCDSFSVWFRIVAADPHRLHSWVRPAKEAKITVVLTRWSCGGC